MKAQLLLVNLTTALVFGCGGNKCHTQKQPASPTKVANLSGPDSAKTVEEIKKTVLMGKEWMIHEVNGLKILVGMAELPTSGESYIDVLGYVYNRHFKEWRRFCLVKTRNVGLGEIGVDTGEGVLYLLAKANNELKGKRVFQIDLRTLSDDRAYGVKPTK